MNQTLLNRIRQCPSLPSLPAIAVQVLELAQDEQANLPEIARVISKDPALSGKILRTVNSSFYARSQHVGTISHALVILGLQSVKTLVLGFSLVSNLSQAKPAAFNHVRYWRHSIFAATAAKTIAGRVGLVQQEEAFLAALLMDIGLLVLDQVLGPEYGELYARAETHDELPALEREALEMTHADVAGALAQDWKLPPLLAVPMASHHDPDAAADPALRSVAEIAHLAGRCADVFMDRSAAGAIADVRALCAKRLGLDEAQSDELLDEINKRTREIASLFEINIGSVQEYETILKRANQALVDVNLRAHQEAAVLQRHHARLQQQARTDALTGLANRAHLDEVLSAEFDRAVRSGQPLSFMLLDLDRFKRINDTHGHTAGDAVLRSVGKLLQAATRGADLAARYGGEEMAIVLPETDRAAAALAAERIRRAIEARPFPIGEGKSIPVTASIGLATYAAETPFRHVAHLLRATDLALYNAKNAGRNCVKVFSFAATKSPAAASSAPAPPVESVVADT